MTKRRSSTAGGSAADGDLGIDAAATVRILTEFIRSELGRTGKRRLVVGLSGGIDSAVAAFLAVRALGPDALHCLLMPYRSSSRESIEDAEKVVRQLGTPSETIDISPMVDGFGKVSGEVDRLRLGNVMARARMILLFDRSAELDALVLGTSNKTELLLGYGTLHGDLASALNPLGDLYKTQVRRLAEELDVPDSIRLKPPSADLWPDQSDEREFGFSYDEVDRLLALLVDERVSRETAVRRGCSPELLERVTRLVVGSQFKRRLPVIAKVSPRSVGWDFRYPRDWKS
jgi:NAD+ synthase